MKSESDALGADGGQGSFEDFYIRDSSIRGYSCKICANASRPYSTTHVGHMREHMLARHFPEKKPCPYCQKLMKNGSSLRMHIKKCYKKIMDDGVFSNDKQVTEDLDYEEIPIEQE